MSLRVKFAHLEDVKYHLYIYSIPFQVSSPGCKWVFNSSVTVTSQFTWPWAPVEDVHDASSAWQCWWGDLTWRPESQKECFLLNLEKNDNIKYDTSFVVDIVGEDFLRLWITICFSHRNTRVNSMNEIETEPPTRSSLNLTNTKNNVLLILGIFFVQSDWSWAFREINFVNNDNIGPRGFNGQRLEPEKLLILRCLSLSGHESSMLLQ